MAQSSALPRAGFLATFLRSFAWMEVVFAWLLPAIFDLFVGHATSRKRAERFKNALQRAGGTLVKLGQQLSLRADVLDYAWCEELGGLLDSAPPMDFDQARTIIEESAGRPLSELFESLDPEPIGSASIACVYKATLLDGRPVAVKVRRDGIARDMATDLRLMHWIARTAEFLSIFREGQATGAVAQLAHVFREELDFRLEARYLGLFRKASRKWRIGWMTAPKVHVKLSSTCVLVTDFVDGVPATELLHAVDTNDVRALESYAEQGIDPEKVAERLLIGWNFQVFDFPLFHGDPHPANVFVLPGSKLCLIDFGAIGWFPKPSQQALRQVQQCLLTHDVAGMARAAMKLMEPYPPIDVDAFERDLQNLYADYVFAAFSNNAEWWEKATSRIWFDYISLARRYEVPVSLDSLRLFRATFLMDTVAFRLAPDLSLKRSYKKFLKSEARKMMRLLRDKGGQALGLRPLEDVRRSIDIWRTADKLLARTEALAELSQSRFAALPEKLYYMVSMLGRVAATGLVIAVVLAAGLTLGEWSNTGFGAWLRRVVNAGHARASQLVNDGDPSDVDSLVEVVTSPFYLVVLVVILLLYMLRVRKRILDVDPK